MFSIAIISKSVVINDCEYNIVTDRKDMYENLSGEYDAIIIENNYPSLDNGHDIAYLKDIQGDMIVEAKIKLNDGEWSDYQPVESIMEQAEEFYKSHKKPKKALKNKPF
jgi:hypothetical protein